MITGEQVTQARELRRWSIVDLWGARGVAARTEAAIMCAALLHVQTRNLLILHSRWWRAR
jgi:hypothetical protein